MSAHTLDEFLTNLGACGIAHRRMGALEFETAWNAATHYSWLLWVGEKVGLTAEVEAAKAEIEATVVRTAPLRDRVRLCCEISRRHLTFEAVWQAALDEGLVTG